MIGTFETVEVGETIALGAHRFTREAIVAFATAYDPQPFHLDDAAAAKTHFGRLAASGWHTAAAWMRLYVDWLQSRERDGTLSPGVVGPSPGFKDLRWARPVFPGDTVSYAITVTGKRMTSRAGWGLVAMHATGTNQEDQRVFEFTGSVFWKCASVA